MLEAPQGQGGEMSENVYISFLIRGGSCITPCPARIMLGMEVVMIGSKYCFEKCKYFRNGKRDIVARGFGFGEIKCDWTDKEEK